MIRKLINKAHELLVCYLFIKIAVINHNFMTSSTDIVIIFIRIIVLNCVYYFRKPISTIEAITIGFSSLSN